LLNSCAVAGVVVEVRELWVSVVESPLNKMIGKIIATVVVGTILKVDDNKIRLIIGHEAGIQG